MAKKSSIEWTESTWNPVTGCSKISPGCKNCYAERMSLRLKAMGNKYYANGFNLKLHPSLLELPYKWEKPLLIFVNSMSDLFHDSVPDSFIFEVFTVMKETRWHIFQVLTKRSERLKKFSREIEWPKNVWIGVSIENQDFSYRINDLRNIKASVKFLSFEPLIGPVKNIDLHNINWVILGGESGPKARLLEESWVLDIRDQCTLNRVPFFFKQWGGVNKKKKGRELQGRSWNEFPKIEMI